MPIEKFRETNQLRVMPAPLGNARLLVLLVEDFLDQMLKHLHGDVSQIESSKVKFWKIICDRLHGSRDEDLLRMKQKLHLALEVDTQEKTSRMRRSLDYSADKVVLYPSDSKELLLKEIAHHKNKRAPKSLPSAMQQEERDRKQVIGIAQNSSLELSKILSAVKTKALSPKELAEWRDARNIVPSVERCHENEIDLGLLASDDSMVTRIPTYHLDEHGNKILTVTVFYWEYLPNSNIKTFQSVAVYRDRVIEKMDGRPMEEKLPEIAKKFPKIMKGKQEYKRNYSNMHTKMLK